MQTRDAFEVGIELVDDLFLLLQLPDNDSPCEGGSDEVLVLFTHDHVGDVVFVGRELFVPEQNLAVHVVEARLELTPRENDVLLFIDFQSLDPERHFLQLDFGTQFSLEEVTFRIEQHCLFWLILVHDVELEHEAAVDTCCDQSGFVFVEVGEVHQSDIQREPADQNEMLVEDVQLEVS